MKKSRLKLGSGQNQGTVDRVNNDQERKDPVKYILPEIMIGVLKNLSVKDLISVNSVSRAWRALGKKDVVWESVILNDPAGGSYKDLMTKLASDGKNIRGKIISQAIQKEISVKEKNIKYLKSSQETVQVKTNGNNIIESHPVGALVNPTSFFTPIISAACNFFTFLNNEKKIRKEQDAVSDLKDQSCHYANDTSTTSYR